MPLQYKKSPPFVKGRGLRGGNVDISGTAASSSEFEISDSALYGIIGKTHYYITISLRYAQKESRVGIIQLGLKRRLPTLPPK